MVMTSMGLSRNIVTSLLQFFSPDFTFDLSVYRRHTHDPRILALVHRPRYLVDAEASPIGHFLANTYLPRRLYMYTRKPTTIVTRQTKQTVYPARKLEVRKSR